MASLERADIDYALGVARKKGYRFVSLEWEGSVFEAELSEARKTSSALPVSSSAVVDAVETEPGIIAKSAFVGYFQPGRKAPAIGSKVTEGEIIGEVLALGIVNEITAPTSGVLEEIFVENGQTVEFGQRIARVVP